MSPFQESQGRELHKKRGDEQKTEKQKMILKKGESKQQTKIR